MPNRLGDELPKIDPPPAKNPPADAPKTPTAALKTIADGMVRVEGGTLEMGCKEGRDGDCYDSEKPLHTVTVSSFSISKYEVTQAQWQAVMGETPSDHKGCDQCPVENVSWEDVQDFLKKLNASGGRYRLPTEAEWEFAARGGTQSHHFQYAGGGDLKKVGWFDGNSDNETHPVGGLKANELGLFDMSGNVWEWCSDWYDDYQNSARNDPTGPTTGGSRVYRGGSFVGVARSCRTAYRGYNSPSFRDDFLGLRLAHQ